MTMLFAHARRISVRVLATAIAAFMLSSAGVLAAEVLTVRLDQARVARLPDRVATLVVGNPLIADVSLQQGGMMVITGKGFGVTNLIALDRNGNVLLEQSIEVQGPKDGVVVLYRGAERESYSCTPRCDRRITLGDSADFFDATISQANTRNNRAAGVAGPPGPAAAAGNVPQPQPR